MSFYLHIRGWLDKVRERASRQAGLVAWWQLRAAGASPGEAYSRIHSGLLIRVAPRVYAVGALVPGDHAQIWTAVLYAGPGAMLSHASAAFHRGYILYPPREVQVSTPRHLGPWAGIDVHARRRTVERHLLAGIPVTGRAQTVLDLSAGGELKQVRRALAQLDYNRELDATELRAITRCGAPGSALLRYRRLGIALLRYDWALIHAGQRAVHDDLLATLRQAALRRALPAPRSRRPPRQ